MLGSVKELKKHNREVDGIYNTLNGLAEQGSQQCEASAYRV